MGIDSGPVIKASELGEFAYCRRSWWLTHVQGLPPANAAELARGRVQHAAHGRQAAQAARLRRLALAGLVLGLLALAAGAALLLATGAHP